MVVPATRASSPLLQHRDPDQVGEVARRAPLLLGDVHAELLGDERRVHVVDGTVDAALEGAVQRGHREEPCVVDRQPAVVSERDPLGATACDLHRQPPERGRERDVRAEQLHVLGADRGDVDRVRDELALEGGRDLLGDDHAGAVLRLLGGRRQVRRDDDVVELEQRPRVRLGREDVERRSGDVAGAEGVQQRVLVHQLAAGGVDDAHARLHAREGACIDRALRLRREREVEGEEVGLGQGVLLGLRALDAELAEPLLGDEGVVADDTHLQARRTAGDLLPDPAEAEHDEGLVRQLEPAVAGALPAPVLERRVGLRDVAREREQQADRVLGGRDDGRFRSVRDHDPAAGRRLDVDVVHAHPGAADHLEPVGPLDQVGGQLRRRADDDRVVVADLLREVAVRVDVDLVALAQELDAGVGDLLPDEDLRAHTVVRSNTSSARPTATPRSRSAPISASASSIPASAVVMSKMS